MSYTTMPGLGSLEQAIMQIIWAQRKPLTVREVQFALRSRELAYTTVMTTMLRLTEKGVLGRAPRRDSTEPGGRGIIYVYMATMSRQALLIAAVERLCAQFGADEVERQYLAAEIRRGRQTIQV
jgi:predicted transcriptional regulator